VVKKVSAGIEPLLFAHAQQALIIANERSSFYGPLLSSVCGVVFMGTPHRGSNVAYWSKILANVVHTAQLGNSTSSRLLSDLQKNSSILSEISSQFVERGSALQIRTFYETEKVDFLNCVVCYSILTLTATDRSDC
jgi:protein SERAC1